VSGNKKHTSLQHTEVKSCVCTAAQLNDSMTTFKRFCHFATETQNQSKNNFYSFLLWGNNEEVTATKNTFWVTRELENKHKHQTHETCFKNFFPNSTIYPLSPLSPPSYLSLSHTLSHAKLLPMRARKCITHWKNSWPLNF